MKKIKFIDLFAGIGGIRLGFEDNFTECVFSSEWNKFAQRTYEANFNEKPFGDIRNIETKFIPQHDILLAGFPCQPFSKMGRQNGFEDEIQGTLFFDIVRILQYHKPKAFLLENVPGILTNNQGKTLNIIIEHLTNLGYRTSYEVLDASNFGLPQKRKRVLFVGFLEELNINFTFPKGNQEIKVPICDILEKNVSGYSISEYLQNSYLYKKNDGNPQVVDEFSEIQVKTLAASYYKVQRLTGTFVKDGPTGLRLLSRLECLRLQGFPDDFQLPVSRTQMHKQLGNSVAIPMIKAVAERVKQVLRNT